MKNISYILCNSGILLCTTLFERYCNMNHYQFPKDYGFQHTEKICHFLKKNKQWNDNAAQLNTLLMFACKIYIYYDCLINDHTQLSNRVVSLLVLRHLGGYLTRQPIHTDFLQLASSYDVPSKNDNFFFMFSGHTIILVSTGLHITLETSYIDMHISYAFFSLAFLFQTLRLLGTRGHYSNDIYIATIMSCLMHQAI